MNIRTIPRAAVDRSLRLARVPADLATNVLPNAAQAGLVIDRVDATVRAAVGQVLRDQELVEDAQRRRVAADERERAAQLRAEAELKEKRAETQRREGERAAEQQKREAAKRAQEREEKIEKERDAEVRQIEEAESSRKKAVGKATASVEESIETRAKRARLAELDEKAEALEEQEQALEAKDEANRLADAASRTKAARKSG